MAATATSKPKRRYSDSERVNALLALQANGNNVQRTAAKLCLPESTLRAWSCSARHPEALQLCDHKKGDLADELERVAWLLLDSMPAKIGDASLKDVAIAAGVAIDKRQILLGAPNSIVGKVEGMTDEQRADRIRGILETAARRVGVADGSGTPGTGLAAYVAAAVGSGRAGPVRLPEAARAGGGASAGDLEAS